MASRNADDEDSEALTGLDWKECHDRLAKSALGAGEGSMCVTHLLTLQYTARRGRDLQGVSRSDCPQLQGKYSSTESAGAYYTLLGGSK